METEKGCTGIKLQADITSLQAALDCLASYSDLFGDAAKERIIGFISGLDSTQELAAVDQHQTFTVATSELVVTFKPSDCLLGFLAALAVEFNSNIVK